MREADRYTIEELGVPGLTLMEHAGKAIAQVVKEMDFAKRIAVVCGKGNNGGDGFVAARYLRPGRKVTVFLISSTFSEDALVMRKRLPAGVICHALTPADAANPKIFRNYDLIVDALFGTGLTKPLTGFVRRVVDRMNSSGKPIVAADIPSGIDASTGRVLGSAVHATRTVTFARPKIGHIFLPGSIHCGKLEIVDIGIPDEAILAAHPAAFLIDRNLARKLLPPRPAQSHKGTYGRSVIIAGSRGMIGAAVLATEAAMKIGSGLTTLCVPDSIYSIAAKKLSPEAMCVPIPDGGRGSFGPESFKSILHAVKNASAVLIGPGLGRHPATLHLVLKCISNFDRNAKWIIDADALYAASKFKFKPARHLADLAVTPHAGEMSRLCGLTRKEIELNPIATASDFARKISGTVLLKGPRSIIAADGEHSFVNPTGNSALAKGGSGDVLAGMICGLCAQGLRTFDAARLAAYLHGLAADLAVEQGRSPRTFLASDLFNYMDAALNKI